MSHGLHLGALFLSTVALACGPKGAPAAPTTTAAASDGGANETASDSGASDPAAEPEDPRAAAVHRPLRPVIVRLYGGAALVDEARDEAGGEAVVDLTYDLGRAHAGADGASLVEGLKQAGFTVDRALIDERAAAVFASTEEASLVVAADVGATQLKVSVAAPPGASP